MQHAMSENQVERIVSERQIQDAAFTQLLVRQFPERQAGADSSGMTRVSLESSFRMRDNGSPESGAHCHGHRC
jgi:hypothetical protein